MNERLTPRLSNPWYLHLRELTHRMRDLAPQCPGDVIDYGCGDKPYRTLFTAARSYVGVDLGAKDPGDLELRPDFGLPLGDASVDAVVSTQVLEHIADYGFYLSECRRVLRPGGRLLLSVPGTWVYHLANAQDYRRWTHTGLAHDLGRHGFRVLRIEPACEGFACIAQQFLNAVAYEPSHFGHVRRRLFALLCWTVNGFTRLAMRVAPRSMSRGPTLPIAYVALAEREPPGEPAAHGAPPAP